MKQPKLEDLNLTAIVEAELEKRNCDGLYSPCNRCECGCSRTKLFSCGKACAECRPGMQHPGTSDLKIVSVDEYCEIIDRIEAERKRLNEKRRAEAAANKKAERLEAKGIREEKALKRSRSEPRSESNSRINSVRDSKRLLQMFLLPCARASFANFSVVFQLDRLYFRLHRLSSLRSSSANGWHLRRKPRRLQRSISSKNCLCSKRFMSSSSLRSRLA